MIHRNQLLRHMRLVGEHIKPGRKDRPLLERGDEIGFHPHLYRLSDGEWRQETDVAALREQLAEAIEAMRGAGFEPRSSRIGEAFGSNEVMSALNEFGIQCDSTAMPGRVRRDAERQLDWGTTPQQPYHPSTADYRQPGAPELRLLEVPMSMIDEPWFMMGLSQS